MADEFLSGMQVGAGIGNMRALRQERMMQLQSEDALNRIRERYLSAQADALSFQLQKSQADDAEDKAAIQNMAQTYHALTETVAPMPGETAEQHAQRSLAAVEQKLAMTNPRAALKYANAKYMMERPEIAQQVSQQRAATQLGVQELRNQGNLAVAKLKATSPKLDSFGQAWQGYQQALEGGDGEEIKLWLGRVQKLSGQLPSAALHEGEDLATAKQKLDELNEKSRNLPEVDPAMAQEQKRLQAVIDSMESRHGQEEVTVSTPGGPEVRITKGGKKEPGALTPPERSRYGEDAMATENALRNLNRLRANLGSGIVGAAPAVENFIFDEVLPQLGIDTSDAQRIKGRQGIRLGTQQVLGELNNRQRISNTELKAIQAAMPSLGMIESDPNAKINLDELRLTLAEKGAAAAVAIQRPVGRSTLQALSELFPPGTEGERAMAAEVRNGSLDSNVALQVRKWQKQKGM